MYSFFVFYFILLYFASTKPPFTSAGSSVGPVQAFKIKDCRRCPVGYEESIPCQCEIAKENDHNLSKLFAQQTTKLEAQAFTKMDSDLKMYSFFVFCFILYFASKKLPFTSAGSSVGPVQAFKIEDCRRCPLDYEVSISCQSEMAILCEIAKENDHNLSKLFAQQTTKMDSDLKMYNTEQLFTSAASDLLYLDLEVLDYQEDSRSKAFQGEIGVPSEIVTTVGIPYEIRVFKLCFGNVYDLSSGRSVKHFKVKTGEER
ncbi:Hypothetical predicted protein [Paramuricea clavata]|uniref:Uncharacterized protein n=1 Tax=Paramuricea clavata TaxID=317549 RepID=A0A6S7HTP4_PARCT|nr:Hypothetical predicted protein [Paramuricea clavata]